MGSSGCVVTRQTSGRTSALLHRAVKLWTRCKTATEDWTPGNSAGDLFWDGEFKCPELKGCKICKRDLQGSGMKSGHELNHLAWIFYWFLYPGLGLDILYTARKFRLGLDLNRLPAC